MSLSHVAVLLVLAAVVLGLTWNAINGPVARGRLERFARRQHLVVTPTNGNQVIAYLGTTRRWRTLGLLTGLVASVVWSLSGHGLTANLFALFAGWFLGALVAEARIAHLTPGPRRSASLEPRRPQAYVGPVTWRLLPAALVVATVVVAADAVAGVAGRPVNWLAVPFYVGAVAIAAAVRFTQLRVLRRPQPLAEPDVIEADDAIRSRSLHVLAGAGTATVLYCALGCLWALGLQPDTATSRLVLSVAYVFMLGNPLLGWQVATLRWRVRRTPQAVGAS
jgi:hypothetical protein